MYNYPQYKETDLALVVAFMRQHPFVTIIGANNGRIEATQIPVLIEERDGRIFIQGHMAKKSDHEKAFEAYPAALVLFTGPHTYVSGTWYAGNPKQASTWNYVTVHARGDVHFTNENELVNLLEKLSLHFENGNPDSSTVYKNLPADYREKLIKAIIGFEIEVAELDNVHKLSQNRDEKSYENIVAELKTQEGDAKTIAAMMEERKGRVFPQPKQS